MYSFIITILCLFLIIKIYRMFTLTNSLENFILNLREQSQRALNRMEEIDQTGHFESDDEIGWTFKYIKNIIRDINNLFKEEKKEINE